MKPKNQAVVSWQSPEYVEHHHSPSWYALLALGTTGVTALAYLITGDLFTIFIIVLLGIIVAIAASRKPRIVDYSLSSTVLTVAGKPYPLKQFKSFSTALEGDLDSATLQPLRRLMLPLAIYATEHDSTRVFDALSQYLPHDEKAPDAVDRLAHKLRF